MARCMEFSCVRAGKRFGRNRKAAGQCMPVYRICGDAPPETGRSVFDW